MIKIIAIEREYGSGAGGIAQAIANRLNWTLWDREITCEIARRLKCSIQSVEQREEKLDPTFYRLMKTFMRGSYEDSFSGGANLDLLDAEHLSLLFEKVVKDAAAKGNCVIVGRAAPWFLRERGDAMNIFIYAPLEEKIRRLVAQGKTAEEAERLVDQVDSDRAAFIKKYYGKVWPQRDLYHLMINSKIGDDAVIETILFKMEQLNKGAAVNA
ncbi:MAG TPA: cytidylate kinase-like family protein [Bryobacteraceae bacterium]|jgi:cytidylate kinase